MVLKMAEKTLFVKSHVRDFIKEQNINTGGEILDGDRLNNHIKSYLKKAVQRAKANGRKTLYERDL